MGNGDADTISLIDLKAMPPRVVDTVSVGQTPESLTVAPDGKHVVVTVMNGSSKPPGSPFLNDHGLAPVFAVESMQFRKVTETKVGRWCQGAAWNKDTTLLLVQCMAEQEIQLFKFDGKTLTPAGAIKVSGGPPGLRRHRRGSSRGSYDPWTTIHCCHPRRKRGPRPQLGSHLRGMTTVG